MTTVTVDEDCLRNVEKLQSLLRLQYGNMSGENITRGAAVNFAVSQQLSSMIAFTTAYQPLGAVSYTANSAGSQNFLSAQTTSNLDTVWHPSICTEDNIEPSTRKIRTRKGGDKDASSMGND